MVHGSKTDSTTILRELQSTQIDDPRDGGLESWKLLMERIGKGDEAQSSKNDFDDLMLHEWASARLVFPTNDNVITDGIERIQEARRGLDALVNLATGAAKGNDIQVGMLLRASSAKHSPFLLEDQKFHKSLSLVLQDDNAITIAVLLNLPSVHGTNFAAASKDKTVTIPQRYGGSYGVKGATKEPVTWLHCSKTLRDANVGSPLGAVQKDGIWSCTQDDVEAAIHVGLALPLDFMSISGFSVWPKVLGGGIRQDVWNGNFEVVPLGKMQQVWDLLSTQELLLTTETIHKNLAIANSAWAIEEVKGGSTTYSLIEKQSKYKDDDHDYVYKSEMSVQELADIALKSWIKTFLLGDQELRKTI